MTMMMNHYLPGKKLFHFTIHLKKQIFFSLWDVYLFGSHSIV